VRPVTNRGAISSPSPPERSGVGARRAAIGEGIGHSGLDSPRQYTANSPQVWAAVGRRFP